MSTQHDSVARRAQFSRTRLSPAKITSLGPKEVFVFGSNTQGVHGAGAAHLAWKRFGARWGLGTGAAGQTYAIPTKHFKDGQLVSRALDQIAYDVVVFLCYAAKRPEYDFLVTEIGCGLAGFSPEEIAPMFKAISIPTNVYLPASFWNALKAPVAA